MQKLRELVQAKISEKEVLKKTVIELKQRLLVEKQHQLDLMEARELLQVAARRTQEQLVQCVEKTVTACLHAIPFDEEYDFRIKFENRRNSVECDLVFVNKDGYEIDPLDGIGYGAVDIASFALRIAYWKLQDNSRNTILWDEPFKNLDKEKHPYAAEMIHELCKQHGLQFIISTHETGLIEFADKKFEVTMKNGTSIVEELNGSFD